MDTEIHHIRIPRRIVGTMSRSTKTVAYAVIEAVPVEVRRYSPEYAPVTMREHKVIEHRSIDGMPYSQVPKRGLSNGFEALRYEFERYLALELFPGRMDANRSASRALMAERDIGRIHGWMTHLRGTPGVSEKDGILGEPPARLREVIDDGRAAQAKAAAFLSGRLALVGDALMVRTGLPRIEIRAGEVGVFGGEDVRYLAWNEDPEWGSPLLAGHFRIDRADEAEEFKSALHRAGATSWGDGGSRLGPGGINRRFEVVDADALAACYAKAGSESLLGLAACANEALRAMEYKLADYPDEEMLRFVEARRLLASRDEPGLASWLEGLRRTASRIPDETPYGAPSSSRRQAETGFAMALTRYHDFVVPRLNLESGDEAALLSIRRH